MNCMFLTHVRKSCFSGAPFSKLFKMASQAQVWVGRAGSRGSKGELSQWLSGVGYDKVRMEDHNYDGGASMELCCSFMFLIL